jgi:hypothetical protein
MFPGSVFICDQSGVAVATLFDRREAIGNYQLKWIPGKHLSNGIYFVCLLSGNKKDVRKIVLVR